MKGGEIFLISTLLLALLAGAASAQNCGPTVSLNTNYTDGLSMSNGFSDSNSKSGSAASPYINENRNRNQNGSDSENLSVGLTMSWQLGNHTCEAQASARLHQQKLQNLEQTLRLCKTYGTDHPLLQGKCY